MKNSAEQRKNRKHILQARRQSFDTPSQHLSNDNNEYKPPIDLYIFYKY